MLGAEPNPYKFDIIIGIIWTNKYMSALDTQHHFIPLIAS